MTQTSASTAPHDDPAPAGSGFGQLPLASVEWDAEGRVARWSPEAEALFGWRADEVRGKRAQEWPFVHPGDEAQVRRVAGFVAACSADGLPPVVTGDLNAVPESDEVRLLEGFLTEPSVPDLLLVDAWRYAAPGDRGITWSRANPHAAATGEPDARIDYVLVGTPRATGAVQVAGAWVAGDRPRDGVWPTDHAAVVADLRLGGPGYVGPGAA